MPGVTVAAVSIEAILDVAEAEAPGLRQLARRHREAEADRLGVPLDIASVRARCRPGRDHRQAR